jgi:ADP-ribose pyrophosphatase YjhB (NUDIX family)
MDQKHHVSGKGVCIKNNKILLIKYFEEGVGVHYNIPGGRQLPNERITDTVKRKMFEEAGAEVRVGSFMFLYEYIGRNHDCSMGDKHSVSLIFKCELRSGSNPGMETCTKPDEERQIDVCWIPLDELPNVLLFPHMASQILRVLGLPEEGFDRYIGDID